MQICMGKICYGISFDKIVLLVACLWSGVIFNEPQGFQVKVMPGAAPPGYTWGI